MGYTMHEMNVILFSKEDAVFGTGVDVYSDNDNSKIDIEIDDSGDGLVTEFVFFSESDA